MQMSLSQSKQDEITSKLADLHLEKYNFPVEIMICLPNGTVVRFTLSWIFSITSCLPCNFLNRGIFWNYFDLPAIRTEHLVDNSVPQS